MAYNLCIIKPNKAVYSETFVQNHIDYLDGNKVVLYGGDFPLYKPDGSYLIKSKLKLLVYLIQKKLLKKTDIEVRNQALVSFLKEKAVDVVFAEYGTVGATVCKACKTANVPLVVHFHGADAHHQPTVVKYLERYQSVFSYAAKIIAVSSTMVDRLVDLGANREKVLLNPCGVNLDKFSKTRLACTPKVLFFVGRFVEKKAPDIVISAFAVVKSKIPEAQLIMAGEGPLLAQSQILAKELGLAHAIAFPGVYSHVQVQAQMKKVRGFVHHSVTTADGDCEGTPTAILEASASGLAVISTYHAGIKEAVIHQKTGLLCKERDVATFAKNMLAILENEDYAKELGRNGAKHMQLNYDLKLRINSLNEVIKHAANKN